MMYPGYKPFTPPRVLHYGLRFNVGNWHFDKAEWREHDMTNICWQFFPAPPDPSTLPKTLSRRAVDRDKISIGCVRTLNEALRLHHISRGCRVPPAQEPSKPPNAPKKSIKTKLQDTRQNKTKNSEQAAGNDQAQKARLKHVSTMLKSKTKALTNTPALIGPKLWMVGLWALLVCCFLLILSILFSGHKSSLPRQKKSRSHHRSRSIAFGDSTDLTSADLDP